LFAWTASCYVRLVMQFFFYRFVLAAACIATFCAGCGAESSGTNRVVVIGAGLAGLTAALDLKDAGWDVVLFEARDRVGGRVHTLRVPFTDGLHAEAGGESIDDNHEDILGLVDRFGLSVEQRPFNKEINGATFYQGKRWKTADFSAQDPAVEMDYLRFNDALLQAAVGLDPAHPEAFANAAALDAQSLAEFITAQKLNPLAELLINIENRGEYSSEPAQISLLFAVQQAVASMNIPDNAVETKRISGGN